MFTLASGLMYATYSAVLAIPTRIVQGCALLCIHQVHDCSKITHQSRHCGLMTLPSSCVQRSTPAQSRTARQRVHLGALDSCSQVTSVDGTTVTVGFWY